MRFRRSLIVDSCVGLLVPTALLFSVFLLARGHNNPGGGFAGGLVVGCALVLQYAASGDPRTGWRVPLSGPSFIGAGLTLAAVVTMLPMLEGNLFFDNSKVSVTLPVFDKVTLYSVAGFDLGVELVVIGVVLLLLDTLGTEEVSS